MTRKDYVAIAAALAASRIYCDCKNNRQARIAIDYTATRIADTLAADNPRFDRARFIAAATKEVQS